MKITPFGRYLRKLRIDHGVILKELADSLKVSSAYLSALELGKKNISTNFILKVSEYFKLSQTEIDEVEKLAEISKPQVKISLAGNTDLERDMVMSFARNYKNKTPEEQEKLKKLLEGK